MSNMEEELETKGRFFQVFPGVAELSEEMLQCLAEKKIGASGAG